MALASTPTSIRNLDQWRQQLRQLRLPVDPVIKAQALKRLTAATANTNNIAEILQQDPAICVQLMCAANKSLAASGNQTQSLAHSLSLLGFTQVASLLNTMPSYDDVAFEQLEQYRQQLAISLHAAHQAQAWAEHNSHWAQHEIFWPTLFQRAPIWALWYVAGPEMQQLQRQQAQCGGGEQAHAQRRCLGASLQELAQMLSQSWHLAEFAQHSWQPKLAGDARQWANLAAAGDNSNPPTAAMQAISQRPSFAIALANRLADASDWGWYSRQTLRLQKILAASLHIPLTQAITLSHRLAVNSSRQANTIIPQPQAAQLLCYQRKAAAIAGTQPSVAASATPPPASIMHKTAEAKNGRAHLLAAAPSEFIALIRRYQRDAASFKNSDEMMALAVDCLCQHAGFERASASLVNLADKKLRTCCSSTVEQHQPLAEFQYSLQAGDLLSKLLKKPLSLRLQARNHGQIWPRLASSFQAICASDGFVMMSVFAGEKPIALIYADRGISQQPIDDQQYTFFKQLCGAISQCLRQREE